MTDAKVRGRFVWHELMTTDLKAAAAFYTKVVGWKTQAWSEDTSYMMFVAKTGAMAGYMLLPEDAKAMGAPPCWMTYIGTPDVDETVRLAVQLGGTALKQPEDIPKVGRFAVIQDPQGAVFCAFTSAHGPMGGGKPALGDFSWHELVTTNWEAAFAFYQKLFGWKKTESMDMGPEMGTYQMYGWKGMTIGGMYNKPASMPAQPHWMPYASVPDARRAAEMVKKLGGQVVHGPMEVPGGDWVAQGVDPQGAHFAVHSAKPAIKAVAAKKPAARKPAAKAKPAKKAKPATKAKKARKAKPAARAKRARKAAKKSAAKKRVARRSARKAR